MASLQERFEAKVDRSGEHHLWTGSKGRDGAGHLKVNGRTATAHRVAWELVHGPLPPGLKVVSCQHDKACVRVDHLSVPGLGASGDRLDTKPGRRSSGTGSLAELRPGVWKLTVTMGRYEDGRPRREYFTIHADTRQEAERERSRIVADLDEGDLPVNRADRDLTTDEAVEQYLHHLRHEKGRELGTVQNYREVYDSWWADLVGTRRLRDVDAATMDRGFGRMLRAGIGSSRMNHARSLFVPMFRWAKQRRYIRNLPIDRGYELPKSRKTPRRSAPPEVSQLAVYLLAAVEVAPAAAPVLTLIATTGLRRGEAVATRRGDLDAARQRLSISFAEDRDGTLKRTKTDRDRSFAVDADTIAMLLLHFEQMDARAVEHGVQIAPDPFIFSLAADCSVPMPASYFTKQVYRLKEHLGISDKDPAVIAREDEALRLFRQPRPPRVTGRSGPPPKGGMSYEEIGKRLDRSVHWVITGLAAAQRREQLAAEQGDIEVFDGSIIALRKFSSSELLDAGFNVRVAADRQGHSPETLLRHYAKRRQSADIKAAEHLGRVVHGARQPRPNPPGRSL